MGSQDAVILSEAKDLIIVPRMRSFACGSGRPVSDKMTLCHESKFSLLRYRSMIFPRVVT
jgi:hypothetical protein